MKLDGRIPSHLFIIAFVFYQSTAVFITYRHPVTYLLFIKLNAIFIPWNTNKMFFLTLCCLFFISEKRASASFVSWFLFPENNDPPKVTSPKGC